jgi:branched-chain amino acid aminotransferase
LATREAVQQGYQQVLWTDHHNHEYFEEAGTMNVAFVVGGTLITPALSDRILAGITRDSILTLCREWGIAVEERPISVAEIIDAARAGELNEAFGMGTAAVVSPIEAFGMEETLHHVPVPEDGIAARVRAALSDIRYGRAEDRHGWMHRVAL